MKRNLLLFFVCCTLGLASQAQTVQTADLTFENLHNGDKLWVKQTASYVDNDRFYTTHNQRDPYPVFKWKLSNQSDADYYAIFSQQDGVYTLSFHEVINSKIVKVEKYILLNALPILNGYSDYYDNGSIIYREWYQKGQREKGEWLNPQGKVYKQAIYKDSKLKAIQSIDPNTQKRWKQKVFLSNPDTIVVKYLTAAGMEINNTMLDEKLPYTALTNDEISRLISRDNLSSEVAFWAFKGNVLVNEFGAIVAIGAHKTTIQYNSGSSIEQFPRVNNSQRIDSIRDQLLKRISEYAHFLPAVRAGHPDLCETSLDVCYSPLYYAVSSDTLYCSDTQELISKRGDVVKMFIGNIPKDKASYYAVVNRNGLQLQADFYRVADNTLLKRTRYLCLAPDSILPDGVVEYAVAGKMIPIKKYIKGIEQDFRYFTELSIDDSLPVQLLSNTTTKRKNGDICSINRTYQPTLNETPYHVVLRNKTSDSLILDYINTDNSNELIQQEQYIRSQEGQFELQSFWARQSDTCFVRIEYLSDTAFISSVLNQNQIIRHRYQFLLRDSLNKQKKKVEYSVLNWEENYDSLGTLQTKDYFDTQSNRWLQSETYYLSGNIKSRYNVENSYFEYFDETGQNITRKIKIPAKTKNIIKQYIKSFKRPKFIVLNAISWPYVQADFYISSNGQINRMSFSSRYSYSYSYAPAEYYAKEEAEKINKAFERYVKDIETSNLTIPPCLLNGQPVDYVVSIKMIFDPLNK